ncbi:MAG: hypothetical protein ACKO5Q_12840 [Microcystaceae cyanobacterium]
MTNIPFDQFSKQYLEELLAPFGEVNISQEIAGEARQVDVFFVPDRQNRDRQSLGILGEMTTTPCLLEPFRHQPTATDIRNCLLKLFLTLADRQRQAKRDQAKLPDAELPTLWILASTASPKLLQGFKAEPLPDWPNGVYFLGESLRAAIIALNQLPVTPDTLWLRILGKGKTQQQAIDELLAFAPDHPLRQRTLELLLTWGITIENKAYFTQSEQEIMIKLRALYQENIQAAEEKGRRAALQQAVQERRTTLELILSSRFGGLDPELMTVIEQAIALPSNDYSQLLPQLFSISREDLLKQLEGLGD